MSISPEIHTHVEHTRNTQGSHQDQIEHISQQLDHHPQFSPIRSFEKYFWLDIVAKKKKKERKKKGKEMSYKIDQERDTLPKEDIGSHIGLKLPNAHIETIKKNPIELTLRDQEVSLNALQKKLLPLSHEL